MVANIFNFIRLHLVNKITVESCKIAIISSYLNFIQIIVIIIKNLFHYF